MHTTAKSLIVIAAGAVLGMGAASTMPNIAAAQFPYCWGCSESPGYWVCVRAVTISGAYAEENCVAQHTHCTVYDTSCGPQDFGADGSSLHSVRTLAHETGDEPIIVVAGEATYGIRGIERNACNGAIVARHVDATAGAESRAASRHIVL